MQRNKRVTRKELFALATIPEVLQSFGLEPGCGGMALDEVADIAVKRNHVPSAPGLCGDVFFLFDCDPSEPLVVVKLDAGQGQDGWKLIR